MINRAPESRDFVNSSVVHAFDLPFMYKTELKNLVSELNECSETIYCTFQLSPTKETILGEEISVEISYEVGNFFNLPEGISIEVIPAKNHFSVV